MSLEAARRAERLFLARLEAQTASLQEQVFPGRVPGPYRWLAIVRGFIATAQEYLNNSESSPTLNAHERSRLVNEAARIGGLAFDLLRHMRGAEASDLPHAVVRPLQRWLDDLGISQTCFFRAEYEANYELARWKETFFRSIRNPHRSLTHALERVNWPFLRVTVPGRALGMFPYFALVAHELGHAIYPLIHIDIANHAAAEHEAAIERIKKRLGKSFFTPDETTTIANIVSNWVEELAADAVGLHVAGPSFYFASFGFFQICNPGFGIAETHPPSDLRRSLLYNKMCTAEPTSGESYKSVFESKTGVPLNEDINSPGLSACPNSDQLFAALVATGRFNRVSAAAMVEAIPFLTSVYTYIYDQTLAHVETTAPDLVYSPSRYLDDLDAHLDSLCLMIPPCETVGNSFGDAVPTSLATILNVGWVALLTRLDEIAVQPGAYGDTDTWKMERLHSLLVKAAELSEARRSWEEAT